MAVSRGYVIQFKDFILFLVTLGNRNNFFTYVVRSLLIITTFKTLKALKGCLYLSCMKFSIVFWSILVTCLILNGCKHNRNPCQSVNWLYLNCQWSDFIMHAWKRTGRNRNKNERHLIRHIRKDYYRLGLVELNCFTLICTTCTWSPWIHRIYYLKCTKNVYLRF